MPDAIGHPPQRASLRTIDYERVPDMPPHQTRRKPSPMNALEVTYTHMRLPTSAARVGHDINQQ